ncbi:MULTISPECIES: DUF7009 family protein [Dyadobacter]|uniref:Uncharacterized protein n=1 Tax=Dyadobacter chenhuakuii TaxID=2909339 RepID=A0A9X1QFV3_9BACT|nr:MULTISPECIES: hypothetical protein [Dyadobacter]MCF2493804.1 hypothetical protein [Dyadobacter chenhuakuii]MCF2500686.1 hypothetical protein [Dyadobacter chenhuakuii]MCF2518049.1 hypothetical protein [Dyadobacter sp. CY351]USJ30938.1 hypothetical protein NFI80_24150 [Dyadobacter chenhuakuii]
MKIRIQRNSVRYRLSRTDIQKLSTEGYLEEVTPFGDSLFIYGVKKSADVSELTADFRNGKILLHIPEQLTDGWADNNVVGYDGEMLFGNNGSLKLLIEKDFKCLDNVTEDQSDNYENPAKTC